MLINKWLPIVFGCHQNKNRSFHYHNHYFPLCARCTGELIGLFLGIALYFYFQFPYFIYILGMIPLVIDGGLQLLTSYQSNNSKRVITGSVFGISLITLFIKSCIFIYLLGKNSSFFKV
ncbi:DUF2085 domain-containing protein [Bacillus sp. C1]